MHFALIYVAYKFLKQLLLLKFKKSIKLCWVSFYLETWVCVVWEKLWPFLDQTAKYDSSFINVCVCLHNHPTCYWRTSFQIRTQINRKQTRILFWSMYKSCPGNKTNERPKNQAESCVKIVLLFVKMAFCIFAQDHMNTYAVSDQYKPN